MIKKTTLPKARNITASHIAGNTQIIFTIKSFFALIGTMLGLFFAFYMLVVVPRIDENEKHNDEMYKEQKDLNESFAKEITEIKFNIKSTMLPQ